MPARPLIRLALLLLALAAPAAAQPVRIGIIIDDLGDRWDEGAAAVRLPGPLGYAILPHTPYSRRLAELAYGLGKEVMLHQPMQAVRGLRMGPGGLDDGMSRRDFVHTLHDNLDALPHVRGINNHMGSQLTSEARSMRWLMGVLRERGDLFYIDSRTTAATVAEQTARAHGLRTTRRNVFLDHVRDEAEINRQFDKLIQYAHEHGDAIGIGHPHPETLRVLSQRLPQLAAQHVRLVPVSEIVYQRNGGDTWQASLSPLPRAAKN